MNLIASSLPGRLRLRAPALRQAAARGALTDRLLALPGARSVAGNPRAGSLVLTYDAERIALADMEKAVAATAKALDVMAGDGALGRNMEPEAAVSRIPAEKKGKARPSVRVRVNRQAKRGMIASLLASMTLAALGARRWHVLTGGAFLVFLAAHLAVHRRHLLS